MIQRKSRIVFALVALLLVSACASMDIRPMSAKQQATVWMDIYNFQYDDTMKLMTSPTSTPEQKEIGRIKKDVLMKVWPLLKIYVEIVGANGTPSPQLTMEITDLMNQLTLTVERH